MGVNPAGRRAVGIGGAIPGHPKLTKPGFHLVGRFADFDIVQHRGPVSGHERLDGRMASGRFHRIRSGCPIRPRVGTAAVPDVPVRWW